MIIPVILSGGAGSRLWPLSRELYPKQLLPLVGKETPLQATVLRVSGLDAAAPTLVTRMKSEARTEHLLHREVFRPWGSYDSIDFGDRFQVKRLTVNPSASMSLQLHHHRAEHWIVVSGTARITRGAEVLLLVENQSTYIPVGVKHRIENPGKIVLHMIEVQSGSYLGEDGIVPVCPCGEGAGREPVPDEPEIVRLHRFA